MNRKASFEIYNADGVEITYEELNREAAEFWGVPLVDEEHHMFNSVSPKGKPWFDLYFGIIEPIMGCDEGLVKYDYLIGTMIAYLSCDIKINPRSYKMLIDKMSPLIRLVRHWQDKGYKIYSTRWDREKELEEKDIKYFQELWEKECPPSYAKFGDIQDFNPYLD